MNNIQINGQRRWGPPESWSGPPPAHGTEVFVKSLPKDVYESELYVIFSLVGTVYEVRLPVNWSGFNRGYAFVRFTTVSEADHAIDRIDGYEIRGHKKIRVSRSVDNTRLFLSSVPVEKNGDELKKDLLEHVENVKKVYVYPTLENRSVFRGYAFVEFETHRDAAIAKRVLTSDVCNGLFDKKCVAAWANPLPFLDRSALESLKVLFMRNIPTEITTYHLKKAIEKLIEGEEIQKIKRMNDFAFLTFKDHSSAERALAFLQSMPFLLGHETQVEWAIPRKMAATSLSAAEDYERSEAFRRSERTPNVRQSELKQLVPPDQRHIQTRPSPSLLKDAKPSALPSNSYRGGKIDQTWLFDGSSSRSGKASVPPLAVCTGPERDDYTPDCAESAKVSLNLIGCSSSDLSNADKTLFGLTFPRRNGPQPSVAHLGFGRSEMLSERSPLETRVAKAKWDREKAADYPFVQNHLPCSSFGSVDSEESLFHPRWANSPPSSLSPSASTSFSVGSPTCMLSADELEVAYFATEDCFWGNGTPKYTPSKDLCEDAVANNLARNGELKKLERLTGWVI